MFRRVALIAVASAFALTACPGSDDASPGGGSTTPPPGDERNPTTAVGATTSTTTETESFAIPAVIDEAYVNRVLAKLYAINGDVVRKILTANTPNFEDLQPLRAIYNDPQFEIQVQSLPRVVQEPGLFRSPPGDQKKKVERIISANPECILAEVSVDFSEVLRVPPTTLPNHQSIVALMPTQPGADPGMLNPTPWSIADAEILRPGESAREESPCG